MEKFCWPLFAPKDRVLVAVSGGPDSLSLLHLLHTQREMHGLAAVQAAHLDHSLRGAESAAEAAWVAEWCIRHDILCHLGQVDVARLAKERKRSKQEAAREARYAFLEEVAAKMGATKIATGHTQDDQVETVLLNILRGTGLDGLRGIPARRGLYVRPLRDVPRTETEAYCVQHGLTPRCDSSNLSADTYTRNRIRLELLPLLRRDYNHQIGTALLRLSAISASEGDYLHEQAEAALTAATLVQNPNKHVLDNASLASLHPALLRRVLRLAVTGIRGTSEGVAYHPIERLCQFVSQALTRGGGIKLQGLFPSPWCDIFAGPHTLTLTPALAPATLPLPERHLILPGVTTMTEIGWMIRFGFEPLPGELTVTLDADRVDASSLHICTRQEGDRIAPLGMGGHTKKVSDIFTDAKVPKAERHRIPIIADESGILWIVGYAISERAKITSATTRQLWLTATRIERSVAGNSSSRGE